MERVLLHVCCANCLADVLPAIAGQNRELAAHFYNPNIQPLIEYRRRRKSALLLADRLGLKVIDPPPLNVHPGEFLLGSDWRLEPPKRCLSCYRIRLERTAAAAKASGFTAFTTTLLVSKEQSHENVLKAGREASERAGVRFLEGDWRELHGKAGGMPKGFSPYKQQYCGCIFSEYERFSPGGKHLMPGETRGAGP